MGRYQLTAQQQAFMGTWLQQWLSVPWFVVPVADAVNTIRDVTPATAGNKAPVPPVLAGTSVTVGNISRMDPNGWSIGGIPIQSVSATAPTKGWVIGSPEYGYKTWPLATPTDGLWIEGHPHAPVFPWQQAGAWDKHWIAVYPDRVVEMVGVDPDRYTALAAVDYTPTGSVMRSWPEGRLGVCRGNVPMNRYILTKRSMIEPHVLGLVMPNMADGDGTLDPTLPFPRYGQRVRLRVVPDGLTGDALAVARMLSSHGARLLDINGDAGHAHLWVQPGAQWTGSTLESLSVPLDAFELVP